MAEIPKQVWIRSSMEAAIKLLDARSRVAIAEADVVEAEAELVRLTGSAASIDLSRQSYTHHFECEGAQALAILEDKSQETGAAPKPVVPCKNVVALWDHVDLGAPKICGGCQLAITKRKIALAPPAKADEKAEEKKPEVDSIPF